MLNKLNDILNDFENSDFDLEKIKKSSNDVSENLKSKKLVIYPAGVNGQLIQKTLLECGINVEYFVDRAYESLKNINGVNVLDTPKLKEITDEYIVIISANLKTQVEFFMQTASELNPKINMIDGKNLNRLLKALGCIKRLNSKEPFDLLECENCGFERKSCAIVESYLKREGKYKEIEDDYRSTTFDWFGYIVSQTCTLKCKHCCEKIPYLKDKGFTPVEEIVKDVKKIAESSKFLRFVELIGGEPFLHPHIEKLLTELLKIENIGYIKSFTNATVVPSDELCEIMKNPRFMLQISNYEKSATGKLLENIFITRKKLEEKGVKFLFTKNFEWLDFSSFDENKNNDSADQLKKVFDNCFLINCHRVYKGKLYRCPHQYAGIQLEKLKEIVPECLDIHSMSQTELADTLEKFENVDYIDACKYCSLPFDAQPVPAGEQL